MPGVGKLSSNELREASQGSCSVIRELGLDNQWVHSYVTDEKIYCIYRAPNADLIRKHAVESRVSGQQRGADQSHHRPHNRRTSRILAFSG